jgi:hypothetical protein
MVAPDVSKSAPEKEQKKPEPQSTQPSVPDLGDVIHSEEAASSEPVTGNPLFYHAEDRELARLPKAGGSSAFRGRLAVVSAIGGSVMLLGIGAYAVRQALQQRKSSQDSSTEAEP